MCRYKRRHPNDSRNDLLDRFELVTTLPPTKKRRHKVYPAESPLPLTIDIRKHQPNNTLPFTGGEILIPEQNILRPLRERPFLVIPVIEEKRRIAIRRVPDTRAHRVSVIPFAKTRTRNAITSYHGNGSTEMSGRTLGNKRTQPHLGPRNPETFPNQQFPLIR